MKIRLDCICGAVCGLGFVFFIYCVTPHRLEVARFIVLWLSTVAQTVLIYGIIRRMYTFLCRICKNKRLTKSPKKLINRRQ